MDTEVREKIEAQDKKLDAIWDSVEKTRKYFLTMLWITVALFVLPLIALFFILPAFLSSYLGSLEGLL